MNDYEPGTPCAGLGLAALTITAITVGLLVFVPSNVESSGQSRGTAEAKQAVSPVPSGAVASPSHKNVAHDHA
jgi:hypothetical protein